MFLVLLLYAMFASVFTIAKTGLHYSQPFFFMGTRMALAGVILLAYQFITDRDGFKFKKGHFWQLAFLALFNIYLTNAFEFWGLQYLTSVKTCMIYSLSPFVSALLSFFVFKETMSWKKWIGLTIGCIGLLPVLMIQTHDEVLGGQFFMFSWAEIAVMGAAVCSVYGWILLRKVVKDGECTPYMANGLSMLMGGSLSLIHSRIVEKWDPVPVTEYVPFLECALLLIVISNLVCYNLYGVLLKRFSATFMSFAGFSTPIFTALFGWFYLGEVISWPFYLSMAILFPGLLIFYQDELQREEQVALQTVSNN
jgi:drug/metabolite transporter (DMT)-like permease